MQKHHCPVCGHELEQTASKGRPRIYHPDCKRLESLFAWSEDLICSIQFANEDKKKRTRSRLFYLSNLLNARN